MVNGKSYIEYAMPKCHVCDSAIELSSAGKPVCIKCREGDAEPKHDNRFSRSRRPQGGQPHESQRPPLEPLVSEYINSVDSLKKHPL